MHTTEEPADIRSLTDVELNQVSGGMFNLALLGYRAGAGDVNGDGMPDLIAGSAAGAPGGHV